MPGLTSPDSTVLLLGLFLIAGVLTAKFSTRMGVPALVLFIAVGMIAGSDITGFIYLDNPYIAQLIGILALIIILFEGGLQTKWTTVKPVMKPAISLATIGVIITATIVAIGAKQILGISWAESFLFGAIVGSTDAAAVFAVLKGQNIKNRLTATLEAESGSNDPMAVFLTLTLIELLLIDHEGIFTLLTSFLVQMGIGMIIGLGFGMLASFSINRINLDSSGLYPVFALAFALLTYSMAALMGGSGLLAVYIAALVIGNQDLTYRHSIFRFNEGFAWMMQILMFIILGLLVFPSQVFQLDIIYKGLLLSILLMTVARPIAVILSTLKMNFDMKEKIFLSWAGLRGAVPIVLATFPLTSGLENSQLMFNVVFFVVLTSALINGSTIKPLANKLKLTGPARPNPVHSLELVSIGKANAEIVEYEVNEKTSVLGKTLEEIPFSKDILVNAIIRKNELVTPTGKTHVKDGDILYILVPKKKKNELKRILNEPSTELSNRSE
ncbi:potassium/proton antiporter (CPA1 family) [Melghiribacillus thermohalophilus]|uniref:Potassium/proton antiporter (CPA1 family) n=1 Tax=Melghiribacillus thermohalophilus TaxID=1324956 RepID=A0A4R3MZ78_9BACI|nr:potassium/proton antiporter [Melghiribacillus thermohalophilus]TCT21724.1 potassium/proton antiporter (CPA1 family) [Melghiribacillus thermohalophilus]